jgi:hypothetical protein
MLAPFYDCDKWQSQGRVLFWDMEADEEALRSCFLNMQGSQMLWTDELDAYQRRQLQHILRHAFRTAPFYADRLAPVTRYRRVRGENTSLRE